MDTKLLVFVCFLKIIMSQTAPASLSALLNDDSERMPKTDTWLQNSNKIGKGFNPLYGSPICYTGDCQMEGFQRAIFALEYTNPSVGSCTTKLIPSNVELDCSPSTELRADTEEISSMSELHESTSKGISTSVLANIQGFVFGYSQSSQTRYMIDKMYKEDLQVYLTSARVSYVRLALFEPALNLSNNFRLVIESMPCCNYSSDVEEYIFQYLFNYFGFTYITDVLLGGSAQQNIYISRVNMSNIVSDGYDVKQEAKIEYMITFMFGNTGSYDSKRHTAFMRYVKTVYATSLGGDISIQDINQWSKTVEANPVVIKLGIRYIFDLITKARFPSDPNILLKASLIKQALDKYIQTPLFCYNNCTSPLNGECVPTGYFRFGQCKCKPGWSGVSCSNIVARPNVLSGLICGLRTGAGMDCGGINPESGKCPNGYNRDAWLIGKTGTGVMSFCYKSNTDTNIGPVGTICGLTVGPNGQRCGGRDPWSEGCPDGYARYEWWVRWGNHGSMIWCFKVQEGLEDQSGTICGMQVNNGATGVTCSGYQPARGSCPPGYYVVTWLVSFGNGYWSFCVKK